MQTQRKWWQSEVVYQIYPASFKDANNDGVGDLRGIIEKLPYLSKLGITMLWLSPIYQSPMVDNGYDISDYQKINPQFGTLADFDELVRKAHALDIKIIMDLVVNHTSNQHKWFQQALADKNSPYRNYYIFKKGKPGLPPNNWRSNFGQGSAWTPVPNEQDMFYLHVFAPEQPDLNWENPEMRQAIYQMIRWWLKRGLAGFRIDAITFIKKDQDFASVPADGNDGLAKIKYKSENRPGIDVFLNELKQATFEPFDAVTVGEASGVKYDQLAKFIGPKGYFSMIFDFKYADIDVQSGSEWYHRRHWTVAELRDKLFKSQSEIQKVGWAANFLENHDQPRSVSKYITDPNYQNAIGAKALGLLYFCLRGCPFIFQGEELGMQNVARQKITDFNDLSSRDNYQRAIEEGFSKEDALRFVNLRSRDNARVPFPWNADQNFGFNRGHEPWLKLGASRQGQDVAAQEDDSDSVLNFYRQLIKLRNQSDLSSDLIDGAFKPLSGLGETMIAYQRGQHVQVYVNLSSQPVTCDLPKHRLRLNNYATESFEYGKFNFQPYQAILIEVQ